MNQNPFQALVSLVELDHAIELLMNEKKSAEKIVVQAQKQLTVLEEEKQTLHNRSKEKKIQARSTEQEIGRIDQEIQKKQQLVDTSRSAKEVTLLRDEIIFIEKERAQLEEQMFPLWEEIETGENFLQALQVQLQEAQQVYNATREEQTHVQARVDKQIAILHDKRTAVEPFVNPEVLHEYERMRKTVANPIVFVDGISCPVCFYLLSSNEQSIIRKQARVICQNCYRFLYKRLI